MSDRYYTTTPIYYVNDKPHIGHAYTTLFRSPAVHASFASAGKADRRGWPDQVGP